MHHCLQCEALSSLFDNYQHFLKLYFRVTKQCINEKIQDKFMVKTLLWRWKIHNMQLSKNISYSTMCSESVMTLGKHYGCAIMLPTCLFLICGISFGFVSTKCCWYFLYRKQKTEEEGVQSSAPNDFKRKNPRLHGTSDLRSCKSDIVNDTR